MRLLALLAFLAFPAMADVEFPAECGPTLCVVGKENLQRLIELNNKMAEEIARLHHLFPEVNS
jgi:hypothetical protein